MQTVPLTKIHRLLRPLRSSLAALLLATNLVASRENDIALQRPQSAKDNARGKGKGKAKAKDQDRDYGAKPRNATERVRRADEHASPSGSTSSSPFYAARKQSSRYQKTMKYGRAGSQASGAGTRASSSTSTSSWSKSALTLDPRTRLLQAGLDTEVVVKVLHVFRAFRNVLEGAYGTEGQGDADFEEFKSARIPSLSENCSRIIGRGIEEAVEEYVRELEEENDADLQKVDLDEHARKLIDEWYEETPEHCRSWILAEHATSIVISGLEDSSYSVLQGLFETCISVGAYSEASRFFAPLATLGFHNPLPLPKALHLLTQTSWIHQRQPCLDALTSVLLSSSFSSRLFYSDYLSLSKLNLVDDFTPSLTASLLQVTLEVASEMLACIQEISNEGDSKGGEALTLEVIVRVEKEMNHALIPLLSTSLTSNQDFISPLASTLFSLISDFPTESHRHLSPISALLNLSLLLLSLHTAPLSSPSSFPNSALPLSRLSHLHSLSPQTNLFAHLPLLQPYFTTSTLLALSALLNSAHLYKLEETLLQYTVDSYEDLSDVRMVRGLPERVLQRGVFEERLRDVVSSGDMKEREVEAEKGEKVEHGDEEVNSASEDEQNGSVKPLEESPFAQWSIARPSRRVAGSYTHGCGGNAFPKTPTRVGRLRRRPKKGGKGDSWSDEKVRRTLLETGFDEVDGESDDEEDEEEEDEVVGDDRGSSRPREDSHPIPIIDLSVDSEPEIGEQSPPATSTLILKRAPRTQFAEVDDLDFLSVVQNPAKGRKRKRRRISLAARNVVVEQKEAQGESSEDELAI